MAGQRAEGGRVQGREGAVGSAGAANQGLPSHLHLPSNLFGEVGWNQNRRVAAWTIGWTSQRPLGRTASGVESALSPHCLLQCGHFPPRCEHVKSGGEPKMSTICHCTNRLWLENV